MKATIKLKLKNLFRFLEEGDKVKVTLRFRGREMAHPELGRAVLERIEQDIEGKGIIEQRPKLEGRQMVMVVAPDKSTKKHLRNSIKESSCQK